MNSFYYSVFLITDNVNKYLNKSIFLLFIYRLFIPEFKLFSSYFN